MPYLAFPRILGGTGPISWLVLAAIVLLVIVVGRVVYKMLQEEV